MAYSNIVLHIFLTAIVSFLLVYPATCSIPSTRRHRIQLNQLLGNDPEQASTVLKTKVKRDSEGAAAVELKKVRNSKQRSPKRELKSDADRVLFLQSTLRRDNQFSVLSDATQGTRIPLTSGRKLDTLNYVVRIGIGSQEMTVLVDTGSDLTWVQCSPCTNCYQQQDSLYNSSLSSSYTPLACNSSVCRSLEMSSGCTAADACAYDVSYGDGSYTRGDLSRDKLIFGTDTMDDFLFGCGRINRGLFGGAAGLLGLGRSNPSLVSQSFAEYKGVFSYCLPSSHENSGSLVLGDLSSAFAYNTTPFVYTSMVQHPQVSTFYFLYLTGISIGGVYINASSPSTGSSNNGRTLIDSGTVITRLGPSLYKALKEEYIKQATGFPSAPSYSILDTCFNLSELTEVSVPTIQFHFGDVDGVAADSVQVNVDASGIMYAVKRDASQVCLALASLRSEDDSAIFGNYQQQNLRIVYDLKESKVGFAAEICR